MKEWIRQKDLEDYIETIRIKEPYITTMNLSVYDDKTKVQYDIFSSAKKTVHNTYTIVINWEKYETIFDNDYLCNTLDEVKEIVTYFQNNLEQAIKG